MDSDDGDKRRKTGDRRALEDEDVDMPDDSFVEMVSDAQELAPSPDELAFQARVYEMQHNIIPNTQITTLAGISRNIGIILPHDVDADGEPETQIGRRRPPPDAGEAIDIEKDVQLDYLTRREGMGFTPAMRVMFVHSKLPIYPEKPAGDHVPLYVPHMRQAFRYLYSAHGTWQLPVLLLIVIPDEHSLSPGLRWIVAFRYLDDATYESRWYIADPEGEHPEIAHEDDIGAVEAQRLAAEQTASVRQEVIAQITGADAMLSSTIAKRLRTTLIPKSVTSFLDVYRGPEGYAARRRTKDNIPDVALGIFCAFAHWWSAGYEPDEIVERVATTSYRYIQAGELLRRVTPASDGQGRDLSGALMNCVPSKLLVDLHSDADVSFSAR